MHPRHSCLVYLLTIFNALALSGCAGVSCPFTRPSCCDNALFGCGPFDLPQGCSCSDYLSRSFSGAPISRATKQISSRGIQDSTWRLSLVRQSGDCTYLRNSLQTTLLIRSQGKQLQVKALGYPRLRGTRSSRSMKMRGKRQIAFPACTVQLDASILLTTPSQGTAQGSVEISCSASSLSCSATYSGLARRI
jgi:hypothetical protein